MKKRPETQSRTARAQQLFVQFYAQCFWSWSAKHVITESDLPAIIKGLKTYGGHEGVKLANTLCL